MHFNQALWSFLTGWQCSPAQSVRAVAGLLHPDTTEPQGPFHENTGQTETMNSACGSLYFCHCAALRSLMLTVQMWNWTKWSGVCHAYTALMTEAVITGIKQSDMCVSVCYILLCLHCMCFFYCVVISVQRPFVFCTHTEQQQRYENRSKCFSTFIEIPSPDWRVEGDNVYEGAVAMCHCPCWNRGRMKGRRRSETKSNVSLGQNNWNLQWNQFKCES